jgi:hypothetical protein
LICYWENLPCTAGQRTSLVRLLLNLCTKYTKGKFTKIVYLIYFKGKINEKSIFDLFEALVSC